MITIDVQDRDVLSALQGLQSKLTDMRPVFDVIGQELETRIGERFEHEVDPSGAPWADWAESTKKSYPTDGAGKILHRRGDLLGSLSHQVTADGVVVGFGQPYAAYHEYGTVKMPRRGMLFADPDSGALGEDDRQSILDLLSQYLM